jgi:thiol:disulfide interchange protein
MKYVKYSFGSLILLFALYYGYIGGGLFISGRRLVASARSAPGVEAQAGSADSALQTALQQGRAEGRPVFIDFAASWCKNCEAMDAAVFPAAEVKQELKNFIVVKYDAEKPNESPAREVLDRFGVMGLPTYVVLAPQK